ncbi:phosphotransferase family protein [Promicromonospora thailandica]|uniref:Phosphotransferase enzyme family protein n=1 Tax=Promicromonospora thailandica TaxID=765201 RepID=A0A9X2JZS0_9MICO|nr:aminoglycoside phosphotransferase family protein [Promicromonospora thailandica]MCP2266329.1 Phosphotransferase enzyme family protein [Promicromonospora thailandica]BFF20000.1 hypothetical protein GCM10025730_35210 [Promicromonospora thailandica]
MPADLLGAALTAFGVTPTGAPASAEARSGAGVHQVRTAAGAPAYLKVTPVALGAWAVAAAERELRFYRAVAPTLPVPTPALLDAAALPAGLALLLSDAGAARPASAWTDRDWAELGGQLAVLHSSPLPEGSWDRRDPLREPLPDAGLVRAFWASDLPDVLPEHRARIVERLDARPTVFVHGDCHAANVLHSGRGLALCDWQSAGFGRASADLAFLSVRAAPAGVRIPPTLLAGYLARSPADADALRRAVLLEELATYVFEWPAYAGYNDAAGIARVRRRTRALADRLRDALTEP